jgi:hypothetical protein
LARRVLYVPQLLGAPDIESVANLTTEIVKDPLGKTARLAAERAQSILSEMIQPPAGNLSEAILLAMKHACAGRLADISKSIPTES